VTPELSILLVTDSLATIAATLQCYRHQGDLSRLEIVVAVVGGGPCAGDAIRAMGFPQVRVIDGGAGISRVAEARAVRAATAPFVVFAQAKAYPRAGFVDALLAARRSGPWTVIGPRIANANSDATLSRATAWVNYARWMNSSARGETDSLPGHNSAYDRTALLALGPELELSLEAGWQLHTQLRARRGRFFFEPDACVECPNPATIGRFVVRFYRLGRKVAGQRRRPWPLTRRWAYALGAPLIPIVRISRMAADASRRRPQYAEWRLVPWVALALTVSAAGEFVGYLFGEGSPPRFSSDL
jgi:hypothetical protein